MNIGNWVKRPPGGKWHLVESVVAEDAVTRCGRRMDRFLRTPAPQHHRELQVSEVMPLTRMIGQPQLCKGGCDSWNVAIVDDGNGIREVAREDIADHFEDDASTHDETVP